MQVWIVVTLYILFMQVWIVVTLYILFMQVWIVVTLYILFMQVRGYRNGSINLCIHENTIFTQTTKIGIHEFKYIHSIYIYLCRIYKNHDNLLIMYWQNY
jgi:hypothetical protein